MGIQYVRAALRWLWLMIIAALVAGFTAYTLSESQPRLYQASARLVIGPGVNAPNPDLNDFRAAAQLLWTYSEFVTTPAVLQQVIDEFHLPMDLTSLRSQITVTPDQTTLWLTIRVRSNNRQQAAVIASALANSIVAMSPSSPDSSQNQIKSSISNEIKQIEQELSAAETELDQTYLDAVGDKSAQDFYEGRLAQHRTYVSGLRSSLVSLYAMLQESYTNQVTLVESPSDAQEVDSNSNVRVAVASLAGFLASLAIVFAFEYYGSANKAHRIPERTSGSAPRVSQH